MLLRLAPYLEQAALWPRKGRHILAQADAETVVVYQAYRPSIGHWAAEHGTFGGPDFSFQRMSWIKPSFLWMMYRSGWGTKEGQEVVLAVWMRRTGFEQILRQAVSSSYEPSGPFHSREDWHRALATSSVRLQWDPDHHPSGLKLERRAIQLGLRGETLRRYATEWILQIQDISPLVAKQRQQVLKADYSRLLLPIESRFLIDDPYLMDRLGLID